MCTTPRPASLYRFFADDGELLYVGITTRRERRGHEHAKSKPWFEYVATTTWEHHACVCLAESAERTAIQTEAPTFNVAHAGSPQQFRAWIARRARASIRPTVTARGYVCLPVAPSDDRTPCGRRTPFATTPELWDVTCPPCSARARYQIRQGSLTAIATGLRALIEQRNTSLPNDTSTSLTDDALPCG